MSIYEQANSDLRHDHEPQAAIPLSPLRRELLQWFQREAPSLAAAYEGAVVLLGLAAFPGRVHFIAHAVRDIADRLVFALDADLASTRVQYENHLDAIQGQWPSLDHSLQESGSLAGADTIPIPLSVARRIDNLVVEHRNRRERPSQYELLFQRLATQDPSRAMINQRLVASFKEIRQWFMSLTHLRRSAPPEVGETELCGRFEAFEKTLHSFVGSFFTGTQELDAILQQANR